MRLKVFSEELSVCKLDDLSGVDLRRELTFLSITDEEKSLVCPTGAVPAHTVAREDGWKAFRIEGVLDFSLVGILAKVSSVLAEAHVGIFAISTFNTDYILVKAGDLERAKGALAEEGYEVFGK